MARDAKFEDLREVELPMVYLASAQDKWPSTGRRYLVRSSLPPAAVTHPLSRV
jgi:hypothetical protein